ncbi:MAG: STAS domain-containing protein [Solirubrobacteraceae bacterium]
MPAPLVVSESIVTPAGVPVGGLAGAAGSGLRCTVRDNGHEVTWVHVAGELDIASAPQLRRALHTASVSAETTVLDLRELTFMDCSGLHEILKAGRRAGCTGRRLLIVRGPRSVDRLFELTDASERLEIVDLGPRDEPTRRW